MYLQESGPPPDLTKWLAFLAFGALAAYNVWELLKRGWKGRRDDQAKEIERAVKEWQNAASAAETLARIKEARIVELEREKKDIEADCEHLRAQVRERGRIEREMQTDLLNVTGNYDVLKRDYRDLEQRLRQLESGK